MNKATYNNFGVRIVGPIIADGGNAYCKDCGSSYNLFSSGDMDLVTKTIGWAHCHCYGNDQLVVRRENRIARTN